MKRKFFDRVLNGTVKALRDRRGNVTITFALALIPLVGGIGTAVDYSRANSARTAMQAALDATGLILSKDAQTLTPEQLQAKAVSVFEANFNRPEVKNLKVTSAFSVPQAGSFQLQVSASGKVDTTFTALWQPEMAIGSTAQIVWGMKRIELALALDNTKSMDQSNKMKHLKTAAKDLLKTLQTAAKKPEDVKIAIIPFATDVNVGKSNVNANWVEFEDGDESWDALNGTCSKSGNNTKSACTSKGGTWTPTKNRANNWNGCVWDRDPSHDVSNTATSPAVKATLYRAHQAADCPVEMMPLTNNWTALNAKIDAMTPVGATNVTIGLQMAFQALSPVAPFNASAPKDDLDKVIILLTDGDNTANRWNPFQAQSSKIDPRTKLACKNANDANIKIYAIRVIDGNATLLKECATKPEMYYDVQNAGQLSGVFSAIAQNLANLRLAK